jgi:hypothetical protein
MEIKRPVKEEVEEKDELPGGSEEDKAIEIKKTDRERELEIELAEKRGELKALQKNAAPSNPTLTHEQTKQLVFADINNMSDEDFRKKYNQTKHAASMIVMDQDNRLTKAEAKTLHAEAEATGELGAKFGSDFYNFKDQILANIEDLSESARQDPVKLKRWMETQYLAMSKDAGREVQRKDTARRKIVQDFEKPIIQEPHKPSEEQNDEIKDEIPAESDISDRALARHMNLFSEKERKELAKDNLIYVDMDLTGRDPSATEKIRFHDPKKGFERVKIASS